MLRNKWDIYIIYIPQQIAETFSEVGAEMWESEVKEVQRKISVFYTLQEQCTNKEQASVGAYVTTEKNKIKSVNIAPWRGKGSRPYSWLRSYWQLMASLDSDHSPTLMNIWVSRIWLSRSFSRVIEGRRGGVNLGRLREIGDKYDEKTLYSLWVFKKIMF